MKTVVAGIFLVCFSVHVWSQSCEATITENTIFSDITSWTSTGGASCPPTDPFDGDVIVNIGNQDTLIMDFDLVINGNFTLTTLGTAAAIYIPDTVDIVVNGNMGDPDNNGFSYFVDGTLFVRDTLFGKNSNAFVGDGTITGGTLSIGKNTTCGTPCPVEGGFENCTGDDDFCALPIELLYLNVFQEKDAIILNWATIKEEKFSHFEVQRSGDSGKFREIGGVEGSGESSDILEYSFHDDNPYLGINSYRLKAVDIDGTYEFFGPWSIEFMGGAVIRIYPNPASNELINVDLNFIPEQRLQLFINDVAGNILLHTEINRPHNPIQLPEYIDDGVYIVTITDGGKKLTKKFIKN